MRRLRVASAWRTRSGLTDTRQRTNVRIVGHRPSVGYRWTVGEPGGSRQRGSDVQIRTSEHASRPWRVHEVTVDFQVEDVWQLPCVGGPDDFPRLVQLLASLDPSHSSSFSARTLFAIRWRIGGLLGWDAPDAGTGSRVPTLGDRLPADLRHGPSGPTFDALPFT